MSWVWEVGELWVGLEVGVESWRVWNHKQFSVQQFTGFFCF